MKLNDIIADIKKQVDEQIANAYRILGARPGPGIDIVVQPAYPMGRRYYLTHQTKAGEGFIHRFWPDAMIDSNHQLGQFKRQAEEWGLKYRVIIKYEPIEGEIED